VACHPGYTYLILNRMCEVPCSSSTVTKVYQKVSLQYSYIKFRISIWETHKIWGSCPRYAFFNKVQYLRVEACVTECSKLVHPAHTACYVPLLHQPCDGNSLSSSYMTAGCQIGTTIGVVHFTVMHFQQVKSVVMYSQTPTWRRITPSLGMGCFLVMVIRKLSSVAQYPSALTVHPCSTKSTSSTRNKSHNTLPADGATGVTLNYFRVSQDISTPWLITYWWDWTMDPCFITSNNSMRLQRT